VSVLSVIWLTDGLLKKVNTHAIAFHDAIYSYGQIMDEAIAEGADIFEGRGMIRRLTNRTFSGIRGNFSLDDENNLKGHFELWNFRSRSGDFVVGQILMKS
jgi:Receptor family ligand binding region